MNPISNLFDLIMLGICLAMTFAACKIIKELRHPFDLDKHENDQKNK